MHIYPCAPDNHPPLLITNYHAHGAVFVFIPPLTNTRDLICEMEVIGREQVFAKLAYI